MILYVCNSESGNLMFFGKEKSAIDYCDLMNEHNDSDKFFYFTVNTEKDLEDDNLITDGSMQYYVCTDDDGNIMANEAWDPFIKCCKEEDSRVTEMSTVNHHFYSTYVLATSNEEAVEKGKKLIDEYIAHKKPVVE